VTAESNLSSTERQEIFDHFLQSINLHSGLPILTLAKPTYAPTSKQIVLDSLSAITGVNRLAKDQTVEFANNITVIYGENGTGKTGYSRILKTLGFSYDTHNNILPNIYGTAEPQSATINFKSNTKPKSFTWNGSNSDSELENISVFNSDCVQFSLADRNLIVSPIGFHLFNIISSELNQLTQLLNAKIAAHPIGLPWFEKLTEGTPQFGFIKTLSSVSTEQKLTEVSTFTPEHEERLKKKTAELAGLNSALLQAEILALRSQVSELNSLIEKIEVAESLLSQTNWQALIDLNKKIAELEGKTQTGIKDIAEQKGIKFYDSEEFKSFILAAENYIKIIDAPEYPEENDNCVYCLQPLDASAKELLKSYRTLLNDKTQETLKELRERKANLIHQVSPIETNLFFHQPTFGVDENQIPKQPEEIIEYNKILTELKTIFVTDKVLPESAFTFNYQKYILFLSGILVNIKKYLAARVEALSNLATLEAALKKEIAELNDRKFLSGKVNEVKIAITNHKIVDALNANSNSFSTNAISRKTSAARDELVKQDFEDLFKKELTAFRKSNLQIDLNFGTDRGSSRVSQSISRHALAEILSEGEQKAIALAEFLTELQLDNIKAPTIFDDPVNSLDHRIIDEVVKRLIELSKQRQVVIFTHSILLLHSFIQQSELEHHKQAGIEFKFHRVKENFGVTGILDEVEEINSYRHYESKLNTLLNTNHTGQEESQIAASGYGHLRSMIEVTVEDKLLRNTIKRYKKGVAFPSLLRVDGTKIDLHKSKLNDIYEKCCVSIDGHSGPEEIPSVPTIAELKIDLGEFKALRADFN
jgi:energy-coupling factor transporter ATP-binding protein EcfA2